MDAVDPIVEFRKIRNKSRVEAIESQGRLQSRIDGQGGVFLLEGLYHGNRRVRAKHAPHSSHWEICDDELDLISAIGRNTIKFNANPVDLRNKWGIEERYEYAPVKAVISEGVAYIERTDKWGEAGELFMPTFSERIKSALPHSMGELLFMLFFPHLVLERIASKHASTLTRFIAGSTGILIMFLVSTIFGKEVLPTVFSDLVLGNEISMILSLLIILYASLPFAFLLISSYSDDPSSE